jgi:translation initiation factor 3 subunit A
MRKLIESCISLSFLVYLNGTYLVVLELAEAERQKKEQAERKAKLDEIAEKQRQRERELEEKERQRREALLGRSTVGSLKPSEPLIAARPMESVSAVPVAVAAGAAGAGAGAAAPSSGKYVPKFRRERTESSGKAPPPESDRWGSSRQDDRPGDKWHSDDRRSSGGSSFGGSRSASTWSSQGSLVGLKR